MNKLYIKKAVLKIWLPAVLLCVTSAGLHAQQKTTDSSRRAVEWEPGILFAQDKATSTAAVSTVGGEALFKTPAANITNTLYGRLQGLSVSPNSGEPYDPATLNIRGLGTYDNQNIVIYVDGFESTMTYFKYLSASEIESVSVLKDAAALAPFGMKGANGVLWVVTKRGHKGKSVVDVQVRSGLQQPIQLNKPLDAYNYARLYNQAISNDQGNLWTPKYSSTQLDAYKNGTGTNVNWYDQVLRKHAPYTDADVTFSGGDTITRYMVNLDYLGNKGLYNTPVNDVMANEDLQRYNLRTNLDFTMFKIFEARVDLAGRIEDRKAPSYSSTALWNDLAIYPANIYPVKDATGNWSGTTIYPNNPVASTRAMGWTQLHNRTLLANFLLKEKLDFITPGLFLSEAASFNSWSSSSYGKTATYARFYNGQQTTTDKNTDIIAGSNNATGQYDWKQTTITAGYARSFGLHEITAGVNYLRSSYNIDDGSVLQGQGINFWNNIAYHYENVGGKVNYVFNHRYVATFGFAYSGSDNFSPGSRWKFYPALSAAWIISNEQFLANNKIVSSLKLRASAGKSGNGQTNTGRYLYQQYFTGTDNFLTGNNGYDYNGGLVSSYVPNPLIAAEQSLKYNVGIDAKLYQKIDVTIDVFRDKHTGIVTQDNSFMGVFGSTPPYANVGKVTNEGVEASIAFADKIGRVGYFVQGMAAYNNNKIDYEAEIPPVFAYNGATGRSIGTPIGLIATGFYQTADFNPDGSLKSGIATPGFGAVQAGDIRYKDLNGDGKIDQTDVTKIGESKLPKLIYSFSAGVNFSGFDLEVFFQGAAKRTVNLLDAPNQTIAFVNNGNAYSIAEGAWAYYPDQGIDTRASAKYPRLTTLSNTNNYRASTFWEKSGDFLRLRNVELGYSLPVSLLHRARITRLRVYVNAVNPITWSSLLKDYKMDPEVMSGFPALRSYNGGVSLSF